MQQVTWILFNYFLFPILNKIMLWSVCLLIPEKIQSLEEQLSTYLAISAQYLQGCGGLTPASSHTPIQSLAALGDDGRKARRLMD